MLTLPSRRPLLFSGSSASSTETALTDGLILSAPLNGGDHTDYSGNGYDLTANGSPKCGDFVDHLYGPSVKLDGVADYFSRAALTELDGAANATFSFWVKPSGSGNRILLGRGDNKQILIYVAGNGRTIVNISSGALGVDSVFTTTAVRDGVNTHIAVVYDGAGATNQDKIKIYLNGVDVTDSDSGTIPSTISSNATDISIGEWLGQYFTGHIGHVNIWSRTLSASEVLTHATSTTPLYRSTVFTGLQSVISNDEYYGIGQSGNREDSGEFLPASPQSTTVEGTETNSVLTVAGPDPSIGNAAQFTAGNTEYLSFTSSDRWYGTNAFSLEVKAKFDTVTGNHDIITLWNSSNNCYILRRAGTDLRVFIADSLTDVGNNYVTSTGVTLAVDTWYSFVFTFDAGTVTMYVNGTDRTGTTTGTIPSAMTAPGSTLWFGRGPLGYSSMAIGDANFWGKVLSSTEVGWLNNDGNFMRLMPPRLQILDNLDGTSRGAYWSLSEASGNALDYHRTGEFELTDTNTVGAAPGQVGGGRDYEADNSERHTRTISSDLNGRLGMGFACWFKIETLGNRVIINNRGNAGNRGYVIYTLGAGTLRFDVSEDGTSETSASASGLVADTWYFGAFRIKDDGTVQLSLDGAAWSGSSTVTDVFASTDDFAIGRGFGQWDGLIDEVIRFNRSFTDNEKDQLYANGEAGGDPQHDFEYITNAQGVYATAHDIWIKEAS